MNNTKDTIEALYGQKIRVRVAGLLVIEGSILLAKHEGLGESGYFWAPPGGGLEFGESIAHCLVREFKEETGLEIKPGALKTFTEFINPPLHAVELFFGVQKYGGTLRVGFDPEMIGKQLLTELHFFERSELDSLPKGSLHSVLTDSKVLEMLK